MLDHTLPPPDKGPVPKFYRDEKAARVVGLHTKNVLQLLGGLILLVGLLVIGRSLASDALAPRRAEALRAQAEYATRHATELVAQADARRALGEAAINVGGAVLEIGVGLAVIFLGVGLLRFSLAGARGVERTVEAYHVRGLYQTVGPELTLAYLSGANRRTAEYVAANAARIIGGSSRPALDAGPRLAGDPPEQRGARPVLGSAPHPHRRPEWTRDEYWNTPEPAVIDARAAARPGRPHRPHRARGAD